MAINPDTLSHIIKASTGYGGARLGRDWDVTPRMATQWLTSKFPPNKTEDYAQFHMNRLVDAIRQMETALTTANGHTVLLRCFQIGDDDTIEHTLGDNWAPTSFNKAIHYLLIRHAHTPYPATPTVIADTSWPGDPHALTLTVDKHTPLFAVAHRDPANTRMDLCIHRTTDQQTPVHGADDLTAVDTLTPAGELTADDIGGTGLWKQSSMRTFLTSQGFHPLCDWRLGGTGHPVGLTAVLPADIASYVVHHQ